MERLELDEKRDFLGNEVPREWTSFKLPNLTARWNTLMATLSNSAILILGGRNLNEEELSDGVVFNP